MKKVMFLLICLFFFTLLSLKTSYAQLDAEQEFCISSEEYKLFNMVNEYRRTVHLPNIPLSPSLSRVAKLHIQDLIQNKPDTGICNFHSWSDKGNWQSCCFTRESRDKLCMQTKPQELTAYTGKGYELIYWESREANAGKAMDQWKETIAAKSMMTNNKEWGNYHWAALGVGIDGGFAIIWLGEETDPEKETKICEGETIISQPVVEVKNTYTVINNDPIVISESTGRFYLIFGNYSTLNEAKKMASKYNKEGFSRAKVITKDAKFRISLDDFPSKDLAVQGKKELPDKYKDAWILPFLHSNETSLK